MRRSLIAAVTLGILVSVEAVVVIAPSAHAAGASSVPRPDHVVIVVEENHSDQGIIGNASAPYINSLAASGANMTRFFAETHPSEPNYLALFSGDTQGVTDDSCPHTFGVANLGSELLAAGDGFVGYSEDLPAAGSTACFSRKYARKHNPWVNFSNIPAASNQPFTAFPSDYSQLPPVSFVIPNLDDDMHDGTIAQGDTWLQNNLGGYVSWATTHNSLFVLTFDEDDGSQTNQIPTIFVGARVAQGAYGQTYNHYNLLRTIEDAYGLAPVGASVSASPILDLWSPPSGDLPPTAAFTVSCSGLSCSFDGSPSSDADGRVAAYSWSFGDGQSGSGASVSHTYATGGAFPVTLTVTDDQGASASVSHTANPVAPSGSPFVSDAFNRTVTAGWGSADVGGPWVRSGSASAISVVPGRGRLATTSGATLVEYLGSIAESDTDLVSTFSVDRMPVGGSMYVSFTGRRCSSGNSYLATVEIKASGAINLRLSRIAGGVQTLLVPQVPVPGVTLTPNANITVRLQVTGTSPTNLRAKAWPSTDAEPGPWQLTATDTSPTLQANGAVAVSSYLPASVTNAPVTVSVKSIVAAPTAPEPPVDQPPVASFTASCAQVECSFDATGSSDPDGSITAFAWDFGDATTGSGTQPSHTYGSAATFTVTLRVTDDEGVSSTVGHAVTTTQNTATPVAFVAAAHGPLGSVRTEALSVPTQAHIGDTLLLFFTRSATAIWSGPAGVSGWTLLATFTQGSIVSTAWTKTTTAGDIGAAVHFDSAGYSKGVLELAVYAGVSTSTAPVVGYAGDSGQVAHVSPTVAAGANDLVVSLWTDKSETTTSWTAPGGATVRDTVFGTGGGRYCGLLADSGGPVAAGTYGGLVASTNAPSSNIAMWTVALPPAG